MANSMRAAMLLACCWLAGCVRPTLRVMESIPQRAHTCHSVRSNEIIAVRWVSPTAPRDQQRLDEWCRTIGPVEFSGAGREPDDDDLLTIVTWNMAVGTGDLGRLVRELRDGAFTGGKPVHRIVLLLQEVR